MLFHALADRSFVAPAAVAFFKSRHVRRRQRRRSTQNVFENPPASRHRRSSIGDRSHEEYASLAEQAPSSAILKSDAAEPAPVDVGNTVVPGQTLINERIVRFEEIHDAAVFANNTFEEQFRLAAESLTQVVIEIRR